MSDIIKHSKKVLSAALTVTTIVWSIGLFAFVAPVEAAAGDLVKAASGPAVYLVDVDGVTIHPFPHANVYTSWGYPADFSSVFVTDISGFTVGNDVEFRDGALVRALETPAVYIKASGALRPVVSAEVFETLGYSYDNITWLPQSFLDKYTAGTTVETITTHPNGTVVKYAGSSVLYIIENGVKRQFATSDVAAVNGYAAIPVITIPSSETYSDGTKIVVKESSLTVPVGVGTAPTDTTTPGDDTPVAVGSGLSVSLASENPATAVIIADATTNVGQQLVPLMAMNFTAGSDGDVALTQLTVTRSGISSDSDMDGVYLYDGSGVLPSSQLIDSTAISSNKATFNNASGIFTVSAGTTKTIYLRGDLNYAATSGKTIAFKVDSAASITTNGASVSGSFPMMGNQMSTAVIIDLGELLFTSKNTPSAATDIDPGADQEVWKATFDTTNQPISVEYLRVTAVGSIETDDLVNFTLYHSGTLIASAEGMNSNYEVDFDLSGNPLTFTKGQSKALSLRADIVDGSTRNFYFSFQEATDVIAKDTTYNVYVQPYNSGTWSIQGPTLSANVWTITEGALSVSRSTDSPTEDLPVDSTAQVIGIWDFKASGEDIKIKNLDVFATVSTSAAGLDNGKIQIKAAGSSEWTGIGSTKDLTQSGATGTGVDTNFTFGSTFIVPAATTTELRVLADVKTSAGTSFSGGETVTVSLGTGANNAQRMDSLGTLNAPDADKAGHTLTITAASMTVTKYSGFGNQTVVAGSSDTRLGSAVLLAGASSDVGVSSITVTLSADNAASVSNMYLVDNATGDVLGTEKSNPGTSNIYSVNFDVAANTGKTIDIYADVDSGADVGSWIATLASTGDDDSGATVTGTGVALQTITIGAGSLYANNGSHPASDIIVAGTTGAPAAIYTFSAVNESFTVSKLKLKVENNFATTTAGVSVTYLNKDGDSETYTGVFVSSATQALSTATFDGLAIYVPKDGDATVTVTLSTVLLSANGASGATGNIDLDWNEGFKATGSSSTSKTTVGTADLSGNTQYVRKSKPTFIKLSAGTTPTSGSALYKFTVVADAAGSIEIKQLGFTVTTTSINVTALRLYDTDAATYLTDTGVTVDSSGNAKLLIGNSAGDDDVVVVGTSAKTLELRGTLDTSWDSSADSLSIQFKQDATVGSNLASAAQNAAYYMSWSDRSESNHSTTSTDWINGYLIKSLDEAQSF